MEAMAVLRVPASPFLWQLTDGGVGTARDVAEDSVELEARSVFGPEVWIELSLMVDDDRIGGVQTVQLMDEEIGSLLVGVVGDDQTLRSYRVQPTLCFVVMKLNELKGLGCFATWGCTHVEDTVMGLNVSEKWWKHTHYLLSRDQT